MRKRLDRNDYTSAAGARQLKRKSITEGVRNNVFKRKIQWDVVVLTKPIPISTKDTKAVLGGATHVAESDKRVERISFKGRILDHDDIRSPHLLLEDPCSLAWGTDPNVAARIISEHTTFMSKSGFTGKIPQVGDTVSVFLKPGDFTYNLQYASFDEIRQTVDLTATAGASADRCSKLRTKFNNHKVASGAAVGTAVTPPPAPTAPAPAGTKLPASAGTTSATAGTVLDVNKSLVWPWSDSMKNKEITLVVFYHGLKASEAKTYYQKPTLEYVVAAMGPSGANKTLSETLFLIPPGYNVGWSTVQKAINKLKSEYNITVKKYILGAHSGGTQGARYALKSPIAFHEVYWADPSPGTAFTKVMTAGTTPNFDRQKMWYQYDNWGKDAKTPGKWYYENMPKIISTIETKNGTTTVVSPESPGRGNHFEILGSTLQYIGARVN